MTGLIKFLARIFMVNVLIHRLRNERGKPRPRPIQSSPKPSPPARSARPGPPARSARPAPSAPRGPAGGTETDGLTPPSGAGASPDSPLDLDSGDWKATAKRTLKEIKDDRIPLIAAGMAFYFFLSIFPGLIAFIGIMGLIDVDTSSIVDALQRNMPGGSGAVLVEAVESAENPSEAASLLAAIFGIGTALWSASSAMAALQQGLDVAYDIREDRKFLAKRAIALLLVFATAVLGGVPTPFFGGSGLMSVVAWVFTLFAVMTLFAIYYYVGPNRKENSWRWVSAGGVLGASLWIIASLGFGYYASNFGSYSKTYGPLAGVIVLIFWLYLSSLSVLIGGELNAELERQGEKVENRRSRRGGVR